jgi:hypothetical protein
MVIPPARHPLRFSLLPGSKSRQCFLSSARHLPRAPLPEPGVTRLRVMSRITWEGITLPSSLLWAHAPHRNPLADLGFPYTASLCRLLRAPAGSRWLPTLSLQSLHRRLGPYPAVSIWCSYPFLPRWRRPHVSGNTFGTLTTPAMQLPQGGSFGAAPILLCSGSHTC